MSIKKVYIETYGCQMNEYDTELVRSVLLKEDYALVENESEADIVMLNTCSVREHADRKVYNRLHTLHRSRNGRPVQQLENRNFNIDFVIGPDSYKRLPQLLREMETGGGKAYDVTLSEFEDYADVYPSRRGGVNAWIAVMRGCNNFCTFCVVPYTRGRERSRSPKNITDEVRRLVEEGYQQVTLLGQNVNSYHYQGKDFAYLLEQVSQVNGIERVRFTSPHPKDFPQELIHVMAENPKVCKHIHLPLQAGSGRILGLMNRTYSKEDYLRLVEDIRHQYPQMVITTDVIVGFPTETDEEFAETFEVMEKVQFDSAFIFKYSERKGTIAARKYPDDVSGEKKKERIIRLNTLQKSISHKKNQAHIGEVQRILIEEEATRKSCREVQGRNDGNKLVIFPRGSYHQGDFVDVLIQDATPHVLRGKVVEHS
jgi:tRNA-2-methylthio-N6-dimethylallyladenosine synthase